MALNWFSSSLSVKEFPAKSSEVPLVKSSEDGSALFAISGDVVRSNQKVSYIYDGSGQKLYREVTNGSNPTVHTDYLGMFVRESTGGSTSSLKYIITPEGRIKNTGTGAAPVWSWEYNLTDHLGNVRVVLRPHANPGYAYVDQELNYFPFGMLMSETSSFSLTDNRYLYNGKELQTDFGLNWYDYGARFYDPELARWHSVDPIAETYSSWSPYHYAMNNPIRFTDVLGMGAGNLYDEKGNYLGNDGQDDGRLYVVTDKQEKKQIQKTNKAGGTTTTTDVSSATELPSANVRGEMGKAVDRAGSPSFHEEGGFFGTTEEGGEYVVNAEAGEKADPSVDPEASVNVFKAANKGDLAATAGGTIDGTFHTHPDGTMTTGSTSSNQIGGTTTTHSFANEPSNLNGRGDIPNARANTMGVRGNGYVLAQGNKTVYIYNGSGTVATFPFKQFFSIGIKK